MTLLLQLPLFYPCNCLEILKPLQSGSVNEHDWLAIVTLQFGLQSQCKKKSYRFSVKVMICYKLIID